MGNKIPYSSTREYSRQYYKEHRAAMIRARKAYYERNRAVILAKRREYTKRIREQIKAEEAQVQAGLHTIQQEN